MSTEIVEKGVAETDAPISNQDDEQEGEEEEELIPDPLLEERPSVVREGDFVLLVFGDGRQIFAQCVRSWKGKGPPVKINKRSYPTANLVGLPYGTVLELGLSGLNPLPHGEEIIPSYPTIVAAASGAPAASGQESEKDTTDDGGGGNASDYGSTFPVMGAVEQSNDNRHLVDSNTSQSMRQEELTRLRRLGTDGKAIVDKLIENSSTFDKKTEFSKAKYVLRKQIKYQPRCRMVRCTAATIGEAMYLKDPRRIMNLREDTLGQLLSFSNISAGCQVLVMETCMGLVTGAVAERMGGYGRVLSVYSGQQPAYLEMINRFNLSFAENYSIKWIHSGDVFAEDVVTSNNPEAIDPERVERESLVWPCPLQSHTRSYLENMGSEREQGNFLAKRCARFARKLTRHTAMEAKEYLLSRLCDSVIIVARYDSTATLLGLLPYLAPSSPFVVYSEFIEPLTECFRELQKQNVAINLRLSDTWMREYQVLPGRTHPNMSMPTSGGFILTGIKLCPITGQNEIDDEIMKEIRASIGGRRGRKPKRKNSAVQGSNKKEGNKQESRTRKSGSSGRDPKRARAEEDTTDQDQAIS